MKRSILLKMSAALAVLSALSLFSSGVFAGVVEPEESTEEDEKKIAAETHRAVYREVVSLLPREKLPKFSRRFPDSIYSVEFAKTRDSSGDWGFVLTKKATKGKKATVASKGYYNPITKKVYLRDSTKKMFVPANEHPLIVEESAKRDVAAKKGFLTPPLTPIPKN